MGGGGYLAKDRLTFVHDRTPEFLGDDARFWAPLKSTPSNY
jgi:hypothetical protein